MKYTLTDAEGVEVGSRSDKTKAIELASATARDTKKTITVTTEAGKEVFVAKPRKVMKKTKRFTRVDPKELAQLGEGVRLPKAPWEPAYVRPRVGMALFRKEIKSDEGVTYAYIVFTAATGERVEVNSTREAGVLFRDATAAKKSEVELAA